MRRTTVHAANVLAILLILVAASALAAAQTPAAPRPRRAEPPAQQAGASADENFDLNIAERHINEPDFHAETAVEAGDSAARGLNLRVGVAVRAADIDVLLYNVRGHVRFRANLGPVLRLLDAHHGSQPATPPPTPDSSP
ncbi:MAG TPA: hypothetical protein VHU19_12095 [Pyrinomonadaceae bacterium]|nr:hypothetical protein [Pyrinomonadaceae bacterium]